MLFLSFFLSLFCALYGIARSMARTDREQYTCHKKDVLCPSLEGKSCLCFLGFFFSFRIVYVNMNKISSELPLCKFDLHVSFFLTNFTCFTCFFWAKKYRIPWTWGQYWTPGRVIEHSTLLPPLGVSTVNWPASVGTSVYQSCGEAVRAQSNVTSTHSHVDMVRFWEEQHSSALNAYIYCIRKCPLRQESLMVGRLHLVK